MENDSLQVASLTSSGWSTPLITAGEKGIQTLKWFEFRGPIILCTYIYIQYIYIWVFPQIGVPQNGWFIMENPIQMGWFGGTTIFGNIHIYVIHLHHFAGGDLDATRFISFSYVFLIWIIYKAVFHWNCSVGNPWMYKTHRCTVRIYTAVICVYIEMVAPNKQPMFRIYIYNQPL